MSRKFLSFFALLSLFLVAAGCGDDSDSSDTDDTTETTEAESTTTTEVEEPEGLALDEWIEQADEVCADFQDEASEIPSGSIEEFAESLPDAIDLFERQVEDLRDLGLPDEEGDTVERALELLDQQLEMLIEANEEIEDGGDPEDVLFEMSSEGEEIQAEADELADDLGLEVCGRDAEETTDTTEEPDDDEPFTYGDDPDLDALWDDCADGSATACDKLWTDSPIDSEYEEFGYSCGGVVPEGETEICSDVLGDDSSDSGDVYGYGDDATFDALWDACEDGDGEACDDLFWESPIDSEYEAFGNTCGGRFDEDDVPFSCADAI